MASTKGRKGRTQGVARRRGGPPGRGSRRLRASAETVSAPVTGPELYMPSNPAADGEAAAGILTYYATGDMLAASDPKPWPDWIVALLERKLAERYDSVKNLPDKKWGTRVARAQAHVAKWKTTKP